MHHWTDAECHRTLYSVGVGAEERALEQARKEASERKR